MTKKVDAKWYSRWWVSGIMFPAAGAIIASFVYDKVKSYPLLTTVLKIFQWCIKAILSVLQFEIPVWAIILFAILAILILRIIVWFKSKTSPLPDWISYRSDRFKNWKWVWEYQLSDKGKYEVTKLLPLCPNCQKKMMFYSDILENSYTCPLCERRYGTRSNTYYEDRSQILQLIIDNVENQAYPR